MQEKDRVSKSQVHSITSENAIECMLRILTVEKGRSSGKSEERGEAPVVEESEMSIGSGRLPVDCRWSIQFASIMMATKYQYGEPSLWQPRRSKVVRTGGGLHWFYQVKKRQDLYR